MKLFDSRLILNIAGQSNTSAYSIQQNLLLPYFVTPHFIDFAFIVSMKPINISSQRMNQNESIDNVHPPVTKNDSPLVYY